MCRAAQVADPTSPARSFGVFSVHTSGLHKSCQDPCVRAARRAIDFRPIRKGYERCRTVVWVSKRSSICKCCRWRHPTVEGTLAENSCSTASTDMLLRPPFHQLEANNRSLFISHSLPVRSITTKACCEYNFHSTHQEDTRVTCLPNSGRVHISVWEG